MIKKNKKGVSTAFFIFEKNEIEEYRITIQDPDGNVMDNWIPVEDLKKEIKIIKKEGFKKEKEKSHFFKILKGIFKWKKRKK